jgi:hypothetical protein
MLKTSCYLRIQKPYIDDMMFSVSSFASIVKPKAFDVSNYKRWCEMVALVEFYEPNVCNFWNSSHEEEF